ncbi:MAG: aromatic ring-hydroxylating dioxygenase subunit alpha [Gammaproteobacteria bacterium]|nr:aromatic ring-hydroxylating dioxygenase subunit alpha [Gammaproteobacteria bacterium]
MTQTPKMRPTLPTSWYLDPDHYQHELEAIWYGDWIAVGRIDQVPNPGDWFVARIGTQQIIVTRDGDGAPRAFHNTCRHRGSILCTGRSGHFRNGRIICPYHTWTYGLDGALLATPRRVESDDFDPNDYPLYDVAVDTWGGFLFVCLDEHPTQTLMESLGDEALELESWPLEEMVIAHKEVTELACNWKIFWENYNECYHCPRIHPELCKVVPLYGEGVFAEYQLGQREPGDSGHRSEPGVADGMNTWTIDGQSALPEIPGLDEEKKNKGMWFATFLGSMFVVGHPQYVRSVMLKPLGPERTELTVSWLLLPGVADSYADDVEHMLSLGRLVVAQDGSACEMNQQGLHCRHHEAGVLVPQEDGVAWVHDWVRQKLGGR